MYRLVFVFGHTTLPWIQSAWEFNSVCIFQLLESCHLRCFAWAKFIRMGENSGKRNYLQNFSWWLSLPISAVSVVGLDARNAVHAFGFSLVCICLVVSQPVSACQLIKAAALFGPSWSYMGWCRTLWQRSFVQVLFPAVEQSQEQDIKRWILSPVLPRPQHAEP
jgi:hypothetical protein